MILQGFSISEQQAETETEAGERVVITGMSGLYPNAHHVKGFADILYNKINPVTSEKSRFDYNHPEVTQFVGKAPDLHLFDAQFFKVHYRLGNSMDPMGRKILEQTYQAIYDAGVSPEHLSGKKVGVYIGTCISETEKACFYVASSRTGFGIAGCSKAMFANRISYWLNVKGPSLSVDQACCSSTAAVKLAYQDIIRGECEAAIVGGANLCLHPQSLVHYGRVMKLNKDGKTKSFDENAEGFAKSDAINVLFLQKAKNALRIYAEIVHVKTQFSSLLQGEMGPRYGFNRNLKETITFLKEFYEEAKIPPQAVQYVEACGSAVLEADKTELETIENIFCTSRSSPLLVGSVMSNVGYGEAASGITAITKVLLGYHTGKLAANLHCTTPRRDVASLRDGRMRVVTEHTNIQRSYVAINGLSITGVNAHVLLRGHYKSKDLTRYKSDIPHLVLVSGRQISAVEKVFNDLKARPVDAEELALLHNIHVTRISGNLGRGFTILGSNERNETVSLSEQVSYFDYVNRPLWFVYSGMGSQWAGMGEHLMRMPVFAAAIERCHRALKPKGLDIVHIITSHDKTIFDNVLHSFVGIAAIQIGLTDILSELGIIPDKIIGHSVGELGCAYADGCLSAEEMILSAYSRGLVSVETPFIRGSMAAVGIGSRQIVSLCPPSIEVACHNSPESCTISGPADDIREFLNDLTAKNIFVKEVPCSNIAYHSRYIADAGPGLLKYLSEVIKTPKRRSERWVSTSVPMDKWDEESAKYSSAEYHTNNLLRPVLFEEASRLIPANAVLVEVAPHGLLQAILTRALPTSCCNVPLTRRKHVDNVIFLLEAIGKLYIEGFNPDVQALYPKIEFPVSTGTPMLSHLVEWAHHEKWSLPLYSSAFRKTAVARHFVISLHDDEYGYLQGHVVKGKILYPFAAVLVAVWDTLAMSRGSMRHQLAVKFSEVTLQAEPTLHDRRQLRLAVALHRGTGRFEVMDDLNCKVATGFINVEVDLYLLQEKVENNNLEITSKQIYNNFYLRDFHYRDCFKSIHSVNSNITEALVLWRDNWVTFLDALFQLNLLRHSLESHSHPSFIDKLIIDPEKHCNNNITLKKVSLETCIYNITRCEGIVMKNIQFHDFPMSEDSANLRVLKFVPHFSTDQFNFETVLQIYIQIITQNIDKGVINIIGVYNDHSMLSKLDEIKSILNEVPDVTIYCKWLKMDCIMEEHHDFLSNVNLALVFNMTTDDHMYHILSEVLQSGVFVISIEDTAKNLTKATRPDALNKVVCRHTVDTAYLELSCWRPACTADVTGLVTINSASEFPLISDKQDSLLPHQKLLILTTYPAPEGLKEYLNHCKNKYGCQFRLVMSNNGNYGRLDTESLINSDLAVKLFKNDVLGGNYFIPQQMTTKLIKHVTLQSTVIGQLESVRWEEASPKKESGISVKVHYAGLNDLDVKRAAGLIPFNNDSSNGYGMDFSGLTESGMRVMGVVANGAASSFVHACPELLWPVPEHWSLEDAATVPLAYCLAYYCFTVKYPLYHGARVLVHGATGALGQAVIAIALACDCEVFATVSNVRKKQFLLKLFPALKANNIGNSRDSTFCNMVLNATNGQGVNFSICNLQGELKAASLKCITWSGLTIDVAQIPSREFFNFGMTNLSVERQYVTVNFFSIFNENEINTMKRLQRLVAEGIARGWVRPLSRVVYEPSDAARAFSLLAGANQRGRPLLRLRTTHSATSTTQCALPRIHCSPDLCHIIISDHEYFGQHLADKLVGRGVRKVCLNIPISAKDIKLKIRQWQNIGVQVSCDVLRNTADVLKSLIGNRSLEPVEGMYIIITNTITPALLSASFVEKMDKMSRMLFPNVKYFAVINTVNTIGAETCLSRVQNGFAGTMIKLPKLRELSEIGVEQDADFERMDLHTAATAAERALSTAAPVHAATTSRLHRLSLLQQLARVAGVTITQDTKDSATLSDLGMNPTTLNNVYVFLRNIHNVFLTLEDIKTLTVQRIKSMGETLLKTWFDEEKGLKTLFSYVDSDELLATTEMVVLPTISSYSTMRADEFDVNETYLCIVPGVEGHHARFQYLCDRLKLPALVLQPGLNNPYETVHETAIRYTNILLEKAGLKTNFYLLGYESGVLVALEVAALLEDYGLTGTIFCLGTPPSEFNKELREHLSGLEREEVLQDAIVRHMFMLMTGDAGEVLRRALQDAASWRDKVEVAVRLLLGRVSHSAQYARQLMDATRGRLLSLVQHKVTVRALRSRLVLMRPAPAPACASALQPHSLQPVTVHALRAPLAHATKDLRCAAIINAYLDDHVLRSFQDKNLCESYLLNADTFMTAE